MRIKLKFTNQIIQCQTHGMGSKEVNSSTNGSVEVQLGSVITFTDYPCGDLLRVSLFSDSLLTSLPPFVAGGHDGWSRVGGRSGC
jgi:hypothetical protein